ncbi:unnamed protein product [Brassica oleracea var. botrytis]|uniref:Uncharacterized protein n=1 Tax=Brassica oleracea TaxID=3712 RepID=A0A3P6E7W5_BRAOL|nr:unnamed protein product [Brassica oleracea]
MRVIRKEELVSIGDLHTHLAKSTDQIRVTSYVSTTRPLWCLKFWMMWMYSFRAKLSFVEITSSMGQQHSSTSVVGQSEQPPLDAATKVMTVGQPTPPVIERWQCIKSSFPLLFMFMHYNL